MAKRGRAEGKRPSGVPDEVWAEAVRVSRYLETFALIMGRQGQLLPRQVQPPACPPRTGAGDHGHRFFGKLGVTLFGLAFTPVFYVLVRRMAASSAPSLP